MTIKMNLIVIKKILKAHVLKDKNLSNQMRAQKMVEWKMQLVFYQGLVFENQSLTVGMDLKILAKMVNGVMKLLVNVKKLIVIQTM